MDYAQTGKICHNNNNKTSKLPSTDFFYDHLLWKLNTHPNIYSDSPRPLNYSMRRSVEMERNALWVISDWIIKSHEVMYLPHSMTIYLFPLPSLPSRHILPPLQTSHVILTCSLSPSFSMHHCTTMSHTTHEHATQTGPLLQIGSLKRTCYKSMKHDERNHAQVKK